MLQRLWQTFVEWTPLLLPLLVTGGIVFGAFGLYVELAVPFVKHSSLMLPAPKSLEQLAKEHPQEPTAAAVDRYSGYLVWASFVGLFLTLLLTACGIGFYILGAINRSAPPRRHGVSVLYVPGVIFIISVTFIIALVDFTPTTLPLLKSTLLHPVAATGSPPVLAMMKWLDKLGLVAALFLAFVATMILPPRGCVEVRYLHQRAGFLRMILYIGTMLLVTDNYSIQCPSSVVSCLC